MRHTAKNVIMGRKPRQKPEEFKTAFFKIYYTDHPLHGNQFPDKELDFPNIEVVHIDYPHIQYYLEGNDIVVRNINAVIIEQKKHELFVSFEK